MAGAIQITPRPSSVGRLLWLTTFSATNVTVVPWWRTVFSTPLLKAIFTVSTISFAIFFYCKELYRLMLFLSYTSIRYWTNVPYRHGWLPSLSNKLPRNNRTFIFFIDYFIDLHFKRCFSSTAQHRTIDSHN